LDRIGRKSDLRDVWEDGLEFDSWRDDVAALRQRLGGDERL